MLKEDRIVTEQNLGFYMNVVGEAGQVVAVSGVGLGAEMDSVDQEVAITATLAFAVVGGILMQDVVNKDLTKTQPNFHNGEVQVGGKVTLLRRGELVTDQVSGTAITVAGPAYLAAGGTLSSTQALNAPRVGTFLSAQDADGFVRVSVSL